RVRVRLVPFVAGGDEDVPGVLPAGAAHVALAFALAAAPPAADRGEVVPGKRDAGGMPAPTPALERGRAVYVLNTCHFCHGVDLTGATMGAADLLRSALVGADEKGNVIGAIARAGIPNLQTSMPSYPDLTAQEVEDLAAYIHYLRQAGRRKQLLAAPVGQGDAAAGAKYFALNCASCHSVPADLKGVGSDGRSLRERVLGPPPPFEPTEDAQRAAGRQRHLL